MRGIWRLAWKYACFFRVRTTLLIVSLSVCMSVPTAINRLTSRIEQQLTRRAESVPFLVGSVGSPTDLLISGLYFRPQPLPPLPYRTVAELQQESWALCVPIHLQHTTQKYPIIGTTLTYFRQRKLKLAEGNFPAQLGDCVIGHSIARQHQLTTGSYVYSDVKSFLNPAAQLPLKLKVTGLLEWTGQPEDQAVITDLKTCWLMDGIGHGHAGAERAKADQIIESADEALTLGANVESYLEITDRNRSSFHFHGNREEFPITAIWAFPEDERSAILWEGRHQSRDDLQLLRPKQEVSELIKLLFDLQWIIDLVAVALAMGMFLLALLIVGLSAQLREHEWKIYRAVGAARSVRYQLIIFDLLIVVLIAIPISILWAGLLIWIGYPLLIDLVL